MSGGVVTGFEERFRRAARTLRRGRARRRAGRGALWGGRIALFALVSWTAVLGLVSTAALPRLGPVLAFGLGLPAAGWLVGLVVGSWLPASRSEVAAALDVRLGLEGRLTTAAELAPDGGHPFAGSLLRDLLDRWPAAPPAPTRRFPRRALGWCVLLALAALLTLVLPRGGLGPAHDRLARGTQPSGASGAASGGAAEARTRERPGIELRLAGERFPIGQPVQAQVRLTGGAGWPGRSGPIHLEVDGLPPLELGGTLGSDGPAAWSGDLGRVLQAVPLIGPGRHRARVLWVAFREGAGADRVRTLRSDEVPFDLEPPAPSPGAGQGQRPDRRPVPEAGAPKPPRPEEAHGGPKPEPPPVKRVPHAVDPLLGEGATERKKAIFLDLDPSRLRGVGAPPRTLAELALEELERFEEARERSMPRGTIPRPVEALVIRYFQELSGKSP